MAEYGRFDVIRYGGHLIVTDMQTHEQVSERLPDDEGHRRAGQLEQLFDLVPARAASALISALARCAAIKQAKLRTAVRTVIHAAAENANEYVQGENIDGEEADLEWSTAFLMTIENKCEDASAAVREWLTANTGAIEPVTHQDEGDGDEQTTN